MDKVLGTEELFEYLDNYQTELYPRFSDVIPEKDGKVSFTVKTST